MSSSKKSSVHSDELNPTTKKQKLIDENNTNNAQKFGIIERVNKEFKRFKGIVKNRAGDFIVNEIDSEGNVVRLTNFDIPIIPAKEEPIITEEDKLQAEKRIREIIGDDQIFENLFSLLEKGDPTETIRINAPKDKIERKEIHDFIKNSYPEFNSSTTTENEIQQIEIVHQRSHRRLPRDGYTKDTSRNGNKKENFKICECALYKDSIDTLQAVNLIARGLKINQKRIGYAGTKDKRAKTTQKISFFCIGAKQIAGLNKNFHNVKLGNFKIRNGEALKLGDLSGNRFAITIRDISENDDKIILDGINSLKNKGFINYYGLQRFGTCKEAPTHIIGKLLIQNKLKEAIEMILKPRTKSSEKEEVEFARNLWQSDHSKAGQALAIIEKINCVEKFLFTGLSECKPNDFLGAFQYIPRNMRLMYLHAYQSFIWNNMVTKRLEIFGNEPVVGDLVRKIRNNKADEKEEVLLLTEENKSEFGIEHVVLPLPGYNINYPENEMKKHYQSLLALDNLSIDDFKNKIKEFSLGGDYRYILVKPKDFEHEIITYTDDTKDLAYSDWDKIEKAISTESGNQNKDKKIDSNSESNGNPLKALVLEYSLPSSAYATMALRELLVDELTD